MSNFMRGAAPLMFAVTVALIGPASAGVVDAEVSGSTVEARIEVAGGISADLTLRFESASNLSIENLGLSAEVINPLDPALVGRLPAGLSIPAGFPVLLKIEPPASGGFSFDGVATVELYTTDLKFVAGSPLRIFSASAGQQFADITELNTGGSYRTRGGGGHYSDFIIVADTRPLQQTIDAKFGAASQLVATHTEILGYALSASLNAQLNDARGDWLGGRYADAIRTIEDFDEAVKSAADGGSIPNRWSASGGTTNVAGELRAAARTLRFNLTQGANL